MLREKNIYKGKGKLQECHTEDLKGCSKCSMPECSVQSCKDLKGCLMSEPLAGRGGGMGGCRCE